jgi:HPt (histidine-containing phosphotransfer) domain-containing protein
MASIVSFTEIEKITVGDQQLMKQLLAVFVNENTQNIRKMREYLDSENWEELKKVAHKLKSSFALVGQPDYSVLAEEVEKTAGADALDTKNKIARLTEACQNAIHQTEKKLKQFS